MSGATDFQGPQKSCSGLPVQACVHECPAKRRYCRADSCRRSTLVPQGQGRSCPPARRQQAPGGYELSSFPVSRLRIAAGSGRCTSSLQSPQGGDIDKISKLNLTKQLRPAATWPIALERACYGVVTATPRHRVGCYGTPRFETWASTRPCKSVYKSCTDTQTPLPRPKQFSPAYVAGSRP